MATAQHAIEINATPQAVYDALLNFDDYPSFVQDLRQLRLTGARQLHGQFGHGGDAGSFDGEITEQIPGKLLGLRIVHDARYEVSVRLDAREAADGKPHACMTAHVESTPLAALSTAEGEAGRNLQQRLEQDMVRFKKHMELATTRGAASSAAGGAGRAPASTATGSAAIESDIASVHARASIGPHVAPGGGQAAALAAAAARESHLGHGGNGERSDAARGRPHNWLRQPPGLADLWDMWQQPWRVMRTISREMGRVVEGVVGQRENRPGEREARAHAGAWSPAVETVRRERQFVVCAELPGVRCDDVQVEIRHDRLTIEGDRHAGHRRYGHGREGDRAGATTGAKAGAQTGAQTDTQADAQAGEHVREDLRSELHYGHFYRVVALPPGAQPEAASARMQDGVLEITVPLAEFANRTRRIEVRPG